MIDFLTRKAAAKWARNVALEDPATSDHDARRGLAKTLLEAISPRTEGQDDVLTHVIFLVRTFAGDGATEEEIETTIETIAGIFVKVGAFGAVSGV